MLMQNPDYASDFEKLIRVCGERGVAVRPLNPLPGDAGGKATPLKHFSWYEPVRDPEALRPRWFIGC